MWSFSVPLDDEPHKLVPLTMLDVHYVEIVYKHQCIALKFPGLLHSGVLAESLHAAFKDFPTVGSKLTHFNGLHQFDCNSVKAEVRLCLVNDKVFSNIYDWNRVFEDVTKDIQSKNGNNLPLFYAVLLRTLNPQHGCILLAAFNHVLGDASSYGVFLRRWSEEYVQAMNSSNETSTETLPLKVLQKFDAIFSTANEEFKQSNNDIHSFWPSYANISKPALSLSTPLPQPFRFVLSGDVMLSLKKEFQLDQYPFLTSNEILMAQCVCALTPSRISVPNSGFETVTRVCVIIDRRGRIPHWKDGTFGNGAMDITFEIPTSLVLKGEPLSIALEIHNRLQDGLALLARDFDMFVQTMNKYHSLPRLFVWNSWSRAAFSMLQSNFGERDVTIEWMNMLILKDPTTIVISRVASSDRSALALQFTASDHGEISRLAAFWPTAQAIAVDLHPLGPAMAAAAMTTAATASAATSATAMTLTEASAYAFASRDHNRVMQMPPFPNQSFPGIPAPPQTNPYFPTFIPSHNFWSFQPVLPFEWAVQNTLGAMGAGIPSPDRQTPHDRQVANQFGPAVWPQWGPEPEPGPSMPWAAPANPWGFMGLGAVM